jgi:hypothetical protein
VPSQITSTPNPAASTIPAPAPAANAVHSFPAC